MRSLWHSCVQASLAALQVTPTCGKSGTSRSEDTSVLGTAPRLLAEHQANTWQQRAAANGRIDPNSLLEAEIIPPTAKHLGI